MSLRSRRVVVRIGLLIVVPLIAVSVGFYIYLTGGRYVTTENAYVKADIIQVSTDVDGRVVEVMARDHQRVAEGDVLFRLDPKPFEIALQQAEAALDATRTSIGTLGIEYQEAQAEVRESEQRIAFLERTLNRQQKLETRGVASAQSLDEARSDLLIAREQRQASVGKANRILSSLGGQIDLPVERHPLVREKAAAVGQARLDLAHTIIHAPAGGIVSNVRLQAGEWVEEGTPIFSLILADRSWVEANLKETDLTHLEVGQKATVVIDAYPDIEWQATVGSISPATGSEFAILPPQNATGNWVKVVQRLPVRLAIEDRSGSQVLRPGMTATVRIDTEQEREMLTMIRSSWARMGAANADSGQK